MARNSNRGRRSSAGDWGVMELARQRPVAAAAVAAGAAAAGLFLWSRRARISDQLSNLSAQVGEWTNAHRPFGTDDTGGLTTSARAGGQGSNSASEATGRRSRARSASAPLQ